MMVRSGPNKLLSKILPSTVPAFVSSIDLTLAGKTAVSKELPIV